MQSRYKHYTQYPFYSPKILMPDLDTVTNPSLQQRLYICQYIIQTLQVA